MMEWKPYNYSAVFKEPEKISEFPVLGHLPFSVAWVDLTVIGLTDLFIWLFLRDFVQKIASYVSFMSMFFYVAVPLGVVLLMNRIRPDDKKVYFYLWDMLVYLVTIKWGSIVFYNGERHKEKDLEEKIEY